MFAFIRISISGNIIIFSRIKKCSHSSGKHFMNIALMGYIKNYFINGRVKNIMQCNCSFHHTKIRADMTTVFT